MAKANKNTIPVYDIDTLADTRHMRGDITAERFSRYLGRQQALKFPHRHSFYHLLFFTAGGGTHTIDFERFPVLPGQIYFMIPGQVHSWFFEGDIDGYVVNFSEQYMYSIAGALQYQGQFPFLLGNAADSVVDMGAAAEDVEALLSAMAAETMADKPLAQDMVRALLMQVFITVARHVNVYGAGMQQNGLPVLQSFRALIEQHYTSLHLPQQYAPLLHITPNHLNAVCTQVTGKSAGTLIRERVLLEARRLLVSPGITVAEVAWQLGFVDNSYFSRFFRKYTGITPAQFRQQAGTNSNTCTHVCTD